jgi:hypothetical protein
MTDQPWHAGLGFHAAPSAGGGGEEVDTSALLLQQYMSQCLSYHEQHQQVQDGASGSAHHNQDVHEGHHPPPQPQHQAAVPYDWHASHHIASAPAFISGQTLPASFVAPPVVADHQSAVQVLVPAREIHAHEEIQLQSSSARALNQQQPDTVKDDVALKAHVDEALAVAMRVPPSTSTSSAAPPLSHPRIPTSISIPIKPPSEYSEARAQYAETRQKRLQAAMLRNFEYVARRDEADMQRHLEELERQRELGKMMAERQQRSMEERMSAAAAATAATTQAKSKKNGGGGVNGAASMAGIGTKSRKKIERTKKKEGHVVIDTSEQRELRCAVYITGLPTDPTAVSEDTLTALFSSYGSIKRVQLYIDRRTGRRKGDGLVVFDAPSGGGTSAWKAAEDMIQAVCEQMSGAQLSCGSQMSVEPADADYKASGRSANASGGGHYGPASAMDSEVAEMGANEARKKKNDKAGGTDKPAGNDVGADAGGEDDLDEFFDSLG